MEKIIRRNKIILKIFLCSMVILFFMPQLRSTVKAVTVQKGAVDSAGNNSEENTYVITRLNGVSSDYIGRYELNYTGNVNYSTNWLADDGNEEGYHKYYVYNDLNFSTYINYSTYQKGITQYYKTDPYGRAIASSFNSTQIEPNSSTATLTKGADDATIVKAYLIWYCRDSGDYRDSTKYKGLFGYYDDPVWFYTPNGSYNVINPEYTCIDTRYWIDSFLCMYADVTDIVTETGNGYGTYGVANIPYWYQTTLTEAGKTGGESFGAWQLVIIEESKEYSVSSVSIEIGSTFIENATSITANLLGGLTTKLSGNSGAQVFVTGESLGLYANISSNATTAVTSNSQYITSGFYSSKDSTLSSHLSNISSAFAYLKTFSHVGNNATRITATYSNKEGWDSYFCMGMAINLDFPEFEGQQSTNTEDGNTVTIKGGYKNVTSSYSNTGISDGSLVVTIDDELTPITSSLTLKVTADGTTKTITGTYDSTAHTVTFTGVNLKNKGNTCSYEIECSITNFKEGKFNNSDKLSGYYWISNTTVTSIPIEKVSSSSSSFNIISKITLDTQADAVDGLTSGLTEDGQQAGVTTTGTTYFYAYYLKGFYSNSACTNEISKITVPVKTGCQFAGYYTGKNGTGTRCIKPNGEFDCSYGYFTQDTTLYAYWRPGVYAVTAAGTSTVLYYEKYCTGIYQTRTQDTEGIYDVSGNETNVIGTAPTARGKEFAGYYTAENAGGAQFVMGKVDTVGNTVSNALSILMGNRRITKDTPVYEYFVPNEYTITCDFQGGDGTWATTEFYEKYGEYFSFIPKTASESTYEKTFGYTGDVQTFIAPYTGTYTLKVWGAQGGSVYNWTSDSTAYGGYGGYAQGDIDLAQGETIYIYVGGKGPDRHDTQKTPWGSDGAYDYDGQAGGYNGGGVSYNACDGSPHLWGSGGGATDIRRNGTSYYDRIIVAGGGGGGNAIGTAVVNGGAGGYYAEDRTRYAYLAHKNGNLTYTLLEFIGGRLGTTADTVYFGSAAENGGGGYYGGRNWYRMYSGDNNTYEYMPQSEGGSNYVGGVNNGATQNGVKSGDGEAYIIFYLPTEGNLTQTDKIQIPVRDGYYFQGYYTGENGTGEIIVSADGTILASNDHFAENVTIYAYWAASPAPSVYTVGFNGNGATDGYMLTMICAFDIDYYLNANAYIRTGYDFLGWSTSSAATVAEYSDRSLVNNSTFGVSAGGNVMLYAVWRQSTYTIRFEGNGSTSGTMPDMECILGKSYNLSSNSYSRTGYTFLGWSTSSTATTASYGDGQSVNSNTFGATSDSTITLYAVWQANTLEVIYNNNGGIDTSNTISEKIKYNNNYTLKSGVDSPDTSSTYRMGYLFKGWATDKNADVTKTYYTGQKTIEAWAEIFLDSDGIKYESRSVTLYAIWQPITYTIIYDKNEITYNRYGDAYTSLTKSVAGSMSNTTVTWNESFTLRDNSYTRTGYSFKEWNTKSDGTGISLSNKMSVSTDDFNIGLGSSSKNWTSTNGYVITLYAIWEPNRYTIQFNSNDDSLGDWNAVDTVYQRDIRVDQTVTLTANTFTRTAPITLSNGTEVSGGYSYIGWGTTNSKTSADYSDKQSVINLSYTDGATVNMYALWKKTITLKLNPNPRHSGAKINGNSSVTVLSATIYNSTYTYTFDISDYYGSYNSNGINGINTYYDSNGIQYRFLGFNHSNSASVPNEQPESTFDVYSSSRTNNYKIYDNTTLYAMWEPVLKLNAWRDFSWENQSL